MFLRKFKIYEKERGRKTLLETSAYMCTGYMDNKNTAYLNLS